MSLAVSLSRREPFAKTIVQRGAGALRVSCLLALAASLTPLAVAADPGTSASEKAISTIQTRSPYCFQADRDRNECVIGFESHDVSTTASMRELQITVDGRRVVEDRAFFQNSLFIGLNQVGRPGYRVPCGLSGSGGDPDPLIGQRYNYQIRAEDSDGTSSQNFGSIGCPAFIPVELFRDGFEGG